VYVSLCATRTFNNRPSSFSVVQRHRLPVHSPSFHTLFPLLCVSRTCSNRFRLVRPFVITFTLSLLHFFALQVSNDSFFAKLTPLPFSRDVAESNCCLVLFSILKGNQSFSSSALPETKFLSDQRDSHSFGSHLQTL
jgi:hypothetical protein